MAAICTSCSHPNPPGFRFCGKCGTALSGSGERAAPGAPSPLQPAEPRSYTPAHLAARILTGRSALEGERKQVTVLFADVAGSTAIAEKLDPEDVHGIMDRCFRILLDEVHRYDGTINQFTGDGVMALFGAPVALENAPERALRAALGIQSAIRLYAKELAAARGIDFKMRIGINTGPVVVGKIGDDLRMDYTAVGDTTNLAARLQTAAEPGSILAAENTVRLAGSRFVTRSLGPLQLKGKSEPVVAQEILRLSARPPLVAVSDRGLTPLVGRASELATLESIFAQAAAGRGQMAFLVGDAGIGKSRLVYEFRRRLAARDVTWLEGRCVSFAREMPLLPILDVVKASFGIEEADGEATIVGKVQQGVDVLAPELRALVPYVLHLLAADPGDPSVAAMEADARRFATFDALKRLTLAGAARRPLVVLIEDLHWIDQPSEEYLAYIADAVATSRVLLLATYRPGYRTSLAEKSYSTRLALQPLSPDDTAAMAAAMLETSRFPSEIRELIANKAEGNPFFIEEVTKSLLEIDALRRTPDGLVLNRELSKIVIPDRIQDVIMARIDRLPEGPKRAIQIASVIGREFAARLLERVGQLGQRLDKLVGELRALELIYEKAGVPELAYMFKHALTHDVAYQSLLVQRRRELHRTIGNAIEELYADRLPEYVETLAHHFHQAEDWAKAFPYLVRAGEKAVASYANAEAVYFYDRALVAAGHVEVQPSELVRIHEARGRAHFVLSNFSESVTAFAQALELASDDRDRARIQAAQAESQIWAHEFDAAMDTAHSAIALGERTGQIEIVGQATNTISITQAVRGDLASAKANADRAAEIARQTGNVQVGGQSVTLQSLFKNWRGEYASAIAELKPILAQFRDANLLVAAAQVASHYTITLGGAGEYAAFLEESKRAIALCETIGDRVWRARQWNTRGWVLGELGALDEAEEANRRSLEFAHELGAFKMVTELVANAEANLADLAIARGDAAAAEPHLAAVGAILADRRNEWMAWRYGMHYRTSAAELAIARGDLGRAHEHLDSCLATAERTSSRRYSVRARRLLGSLRLVEGNVAGAEALLAEVVEEAGRLGNPTQRWQSLLAYGRVLHVLGRPEDAAAAWQQALAIVESIAGSLPADVRDAFRRSSGYLAAAELAS